MRSCGREAEGGGLLNRYTVEKPYRGFESLRHRHSILSSFIEDLSESEGLRKPLNYVSIPTATQTHITAETDSIAACVPIWRCVLCFRIGRYDISKGRKFGKNSHKNQLNADRLGVGKQVEPPKVINFGPGTVQ